MEFVQRRRQPISGRKPMKYAFAAAAIALVLVGCSVGTARTDSPGRSVECKAIDQKEVAGLFDRWNRSLQTGDAHAVLANYAERSILLPTLSNKPRVTAAEKQDYFEHFLENKPSGTIDFSFIDIGCNSALDAGLYTFVFAKTGAKVAARYSFTYAWDGKQWLITSHHSSVMPEGSAATKH
jgi:uncharacterized protein (TIGR02246 family)